MMSAPIEPNKSFYKRRNELRIWTLKKQDFAPIDRALFLNWSNSKDSRIVLVHLSVLSDHSKPSIEELAKSCGFGKKKILDCLHELKEIGLLTEETIQDGRTPKKVYHLEEPKKGPLPAIINPREAKPKHNPKRVKKVTHEVLHRTSSDIHEVLPGTSSDPHEVLHRTSSTPHEVPPRTSPSSTQNFVDSENPVGEGASEVHSSLLGIEEDKSKKKGIRKNSCASAPNPGSGKFVETTYSDARTIRAYIVDAGKSLELFFNLKHKTERYEILNGWCRDIADETYGETPGVLVLMDFARHQAGLAEDFRERHGRSPQIPLSTGALDTHFRRFLAAKGLKKSEPVYDSFDADPPPPEST